MFSVHPKVYSSMFSIPAEIADKALKFANGEQLKVIICIFRTPNITEQEIAKITNLSLDTVNECIEYWQDFGLLQSKNEETVKTEKQKASETQKVNPIMPEIHFTNPTQAEIEKVIEKNGSMKRLFNEAQEILGRTFGFAMQSTIYSVVYRYGITPDVANVLLQFAKSIDCTSHNDILKIAKYWAENGITNLVAADEYINETEKGLKVFKELAVRTGNDASAPSFAVLEIICTWLRWGYNIDVIEKAFNIMKEEKQTGRLVWKNICHMNGTIKKWRLSDMFTLEDIEKGTKKFSAKKNKQNKETSFDAELAQKQAEESLDTFWEKKTKKKGRGA